ncbi:MAG: domain S-box protein [Herminiimonas sp.]|nr:domain S-box protein [Herminiimonas sp.]
MENTDGAALTGDGSFDGPTRDELKKREERFRSLTKLSSDWYWETDEDGRFVFVSEGAQPVWNRAPDSILGKTRLELLSDVNQNGVLEYVEKIARREPFRDIRYQAPAPVSERIPYISISGEPIFEDRIFKGYRGIGRDITEEMAVAKKLAQLADENRALLENTLDIIALLDQEGRMLRVNRAFSEILGYGREEIVGRSYKDFLAPDQIEKTRQVEQRLRTGKNTIQNFESRWLRKSGEPVYLSLSVRWTADNRQMVASARDVTERTLTRAELQKSRRRLSSTLESIGDAFFSVDRAWRLTYINHKTASVLGRARDTLVGKILWEAIPEILGSPAFVHYRTAMETGENTFFESYYAPVRAWLEVRVFPHLDGLSVFFHDITARRTAEQAIRSSEQRFREVIEMTPSAYLLADADATLLDVNPALCGIAGYGRDELVGQSMLRLFPASPFDQALSTMDGASAVHGREAVIMHKQGHPVYVLVNADIKRDGEGRPLSVTAFLTDITARKQAEERLEQLATHDGLTGLPNRALLNERLQRMLDSACDHDSIAVLFIDLDRFKEVNDSMGHEPGDMLLCEVARRLQMNLRPNDVVARLGGDEFVVAAGCSRGMESAEKITENLFAALAAPFYIAGQEVYICASVGISMFPEHGKTTERLFQHADTAMYRAKAAGRNGYRFFEEEMSVEAKIRMTLEHALRRALERNEFELNYQPRLDLKTMTIVGMEALLRWNHPQLGPVAPMQFIPIAEERGLIDAIGQWVLKEACMHTRHLIDRFGRSLRVSVNLSARQLKCPDLVRKVQDALSEAGLPAHLLELELTESALIEDMDVSASMLKELKKVGILLSVDDFGTGYSGLAYLQRFPLDALKLDRSFINQQIDGDRNARFIKAFIDLAHALNLSVVAEGIETPDTLAFLRDCACDEGQGYLLAQPLVLGDFECFLARLPAPGSDAEAA